MTLKKLRNDNFKKTFKSKKRLIREVYQIIKNYRKGDLIFEGKNMNKIHIKRWIYQFDKKDRIFILEMTKNILNKYYIDESKFQVFLETTFINKLKIKFPKEKLDTIYDRKIFLKRCYFIRTQSNEKSQAAIIKILGDIYNLDFSNCGNNNPICCIYLDDVICTGTTISNCLINWLKQKNDLNKRFSNNSFLVQKNVPLLVFTFASYSRGKSKIKKEIENIDKNIRLYCFEQNGYRIKNYNNSPDQQQLSSSIKNNKNRLFNKCKNDICCKVEAFCKEKNYDSNGNFYRNDSPKKDIFFKNIDNRNRFESIILEKGIKLYYISGSTSMRKRPLGYGYMTEANFGFGALFFTWRNIPFNTPMVFWYDKHGWIPLFKRKNTKSN